MFLFRLVRCRPLTLNECGEHTSEKKTVVWQADKKLHLDFEPQAIDAHSRAGIKKTTSATGFDWLLCFFHVQSQELWEISYFLARLRGAQQVDSRAWWYHCLFIVGAWKWKHINHFFRVLYNLTSYGQWSISVIEIGFCCLFVQFRFPREPKLGNGKPWIPSTRVCKYLEQ